MLKLDKISIILVTDDNNDNKVDQEVCPGSWWGKHSQVRFRSHTTQWDNDNDMRQSIYVLALGTFCQQDISTTDVLRCTDYVDIAGHSSTRRQQPKYREWKMWFSSYMQISQMVSNIARVTVLCTINT